MLEHFTSDDPVEPFIYDGNCLNILHAGSIGFSDPEARIEDLLAPEAARAARSDLALNFAGRLTAAEQARIAASPAATRSASSAQCPMKLPAP